MQIPNSFFDQMNIYQDHFPLPQKEEGLPKDSTSYRKRRDGYCHKEKKYKNGYYEGGTISDAPFGVGFYVNFDGEVISGNFLEHTVTNAEVEFANGSKYTGEMSSYDAVYLMHGKGKLVTPSKCIEGHFQFGVLNGEATITYNNKEIFKGNFINNERWGFGRLTCEDGQFIEGIWQGEHTHGPVVIGFANGDIFNGLIIFDQPYLGEMRYSNGEVYLGEYRNGLRFGYGQQTLAKGQSFTGLFWNGNYCHGVITYPEHDSIAVKWLNKYSMFVKYEFYKQNFQSLEDGSFSANVLASEFKVLF